MTGKERESVCFVVGQIGAEDSAARIHSDWVFEEIIWPVFEAIGNFKVVRADKVSSPGLIDSQIISLILTSDIVIADLTGLNANVFYEIGIRHVVQKPIIHMHLAGESIPFDISLFRSLRFSLKRPADIKFARQELGQMVDAVLSPDYAVENPVTSARGRIVFEESASSADKVLNEQIEALSLRLAQIEGRTEERRLQSIIGEVSTGFRVGDTVRHLKFGQGRVVSIEGNGVIVEFEKSGSRKIMPTFLNRVPPE